MNRRTPNLKSEICDLKLIGCVFMQRFALLFGLLFIPLSARADDALDWDAWERLPVLEGGRRMPLDTFARSMVDKVCGREQPKLWLPDAPRKADREKAKAAEVMFPDGPRRFRPAELLFSWLVEPERWEAVPFLAADHKQLRADAGLPLADNVGRLKYASPLFLEDNLEFHRQLKALTAKRDEAGRSWQAVGVERAVEKAEEAYVRFTELTSDLRTASETTRRFRIRRDKVTDAISKIVQTLERDKRTADGDLTGQLVVAVQERLEPLYERTKPEDFSWNKVEGQVVALRKACDALEEQCRRKEAARLTILATEAARQAQEAHFALYDGPITLRFVPALNPTALEPDREPSDDAQPWLGLHALLYGSEELLRGYPPKLLEKVRGDWQRVTAVYVDRHRSDRPAEFAAAMDAFVAAVTELGDAVTPLREKLPLRTKDDGILAVTAYPPVGYTNTEVLYNRLDPFFWSWLVGFAALACLSLTFGVQRRAMFWVGLAVLAAAQAVTLGGFGLRMAITRLVPLTNMFETVAFVSLGVPLLGLWFTLLPIFWPGLSAAWRLTSVPLLWRRWFGQPEEGSAADESLTPKSGSVETYVSAAAVLFRLALIGPVIWLTTLYISLQFAVGEGGLLQLLGDFMVWLVSLAVVGGIAYYVSRLIPALLLSVVTIPRELAARGLAQARDEAIDRRVFALVGAAGGMLAALVAYYAPDTVIKKDVGSAPAVLRDNFWLFVHVLTITSSYAAGALAWGLGNVALGYYLFGAYRRVGSDNRVQPALTPDPSPADGRGEKQPPLECGPLAQYAYKATQVAVLLLAAGTILGALWADKAWGRFWSWDSKEVWSLLTLLAYMAILHARHIGWVSNFGMAFGTVLGATFIIIAWYGVNFLLPAGKHSYGSGGAGGQWYVGGVAAVNWLFVLAATIRYNAETGAPAEQANANAAESL